MTTDIVPVLLGADLNCYGVARAFFEKYGVVSHAFGKYPLGVTDKCKFIKFTSVPDLSDYAVADRILLDFAKEQKGKKLYIVGCTDEYAEYIIERQDTLKEYYFVSVVDKEKKDILINKESFYALCEEYSLPYPKTKVIKHGEKISSEFFTPENLGFSYPIVVKPSSSINYWKHPFENMKKAYFAENGEEAENIVSQIFASGYDSSIILQEKISGNDEYMHVLTAYCDKNAKVKMLCSGRVLLEEHSPKAIGNHAAIITENLPELVLRFKEFLEKTGYRGFANFDIKYDSRDNTYKVFEINLRQGRSNSYLLAAGINIAELLVCDSENNSGDACRLSGNEIFWHIIPKKIVYKYVDDKNAVKKAKNLVKKKKSFSPLFFAYDLKNNFKRRIYVCVHYLKYFRKYRKYLKK